MIALSNLLSKELATEDLQFRFWVSFEDLSESHRGLLVAPPGSLRRGSYGYLMGESQTCCRCYTPRRQYDFVFLLL